MTEFLLIDFGAWIHDSRADLVAPEVSDLPKGRQPKGGGDYLTQHVDWYYRATIAEPRETAGEIAKQDLPFKGQRPNHRQVETAIANVAALLRTLDTEPRT